MTQAYRQVKKAIRDLARPELTKLHTLIEARLQELAEQEQAQARAAKASKGGANTEPLGHIEEKWITSRGKPYGPYRYRRRWEDGTLRSEYLGKAEEKEGKSRKK